MIDGLKPYPAMKDSGVPWLGEVPEHWEILRLRNLSRSPIRNGVGESAQAFRGDWPRYIRITDISGPRRLKDSGKASLPPEFMQSASVEPGDLLLAAVGATYGKAYLHSSSPQPACFAGYLVKWSPSGAVLPEWASYWTESAAYWDQVKSCVIKSTIENFSASRYRGLNLALPPLLEQAAIVRFLDHADRRIRRYIRAKQKLIKLLEEQKQAIIHRAVTRGHDPNVCLKPSGVEWLGDVPEHWGVVALKRACSLLRDGTHLPPPRTSEGVPLLSVRNIVAEQFTRRDDDSMISEADYKQLCRSFVPREKDVLLAIVGATLGKVAIVPKMDRFHVQRSLAIFRPSPEKLSFQFLAAYLGAPAFQRALWTTVAFSAQPGIYLNTLGNFRVVLPPLAEQTRIVETLASSLSEVDAPIRTANKEIALLREYRTRLIADVVTGKLDVREAAARLPEEAEDLEPLDEAEAFGESEDESAVGDLDPEPPEAEA